MLVKILNINYLVLVKTFLHRYYYYFYTIKYLKYLEQL